MSAETMLALVKVKASGLVQDPVFQVAVGSEGSGPVYNTVTIEDVEFLAGQFWSGPPADPEDPSAGPDPANVDAAVGAVLVKAIQGAMSERMAIDNESSVALSGSGQILDGDISVSVGDDLFTHEDGGVRVTSESYGAGTYEVVYSATFDSAATDGYCSIQLERGDPGSSVTIAASPRNVVTPGSLGLKRASVTGVMTIGIAAGELIRLSASAFVGTITVVSSSLEVRRVG